MEQKSSRSAQWFTEQWRDIKGNVKFWILSLMLAAIGGIVTQVLAWLRQQAPGFWGMIGSIILLFLIPFAIKLVGPLLPQGWAGVRVFWALSDFSRGFGLPQRSAIQGQ
jgi:hypothetical protein